MKTTQQFKSYGNCTQAADVADAINAANFPSDVIAHVISRGDSYTIEYFEGDLYQGTLCCDGAVRNEDQSC